MLEGSLTEANSLWMGIARDLNMEGQRLGPGGIGHKMNGPGLLSTHGIEAPTRSDKKRLLLGP